MGAEEDAVWYRSGQRGRASQSGHGGACRWPNLSERPTPNDMGAERYWNNGKERMRLAMDVAKLRRPHAVLHPPLLGAAVLDDMWTGQLPAQPPATGACQLRSASLAARACGGRATACCPGAAQPLVLTLMAQ